MKATKLTLLALSAIAAVACSSGSSGKGGGSPQAAKQADEKLHNPAECPALSGRVSFQDDEPRANGEDARKEIEIAFLTGGVRFTDTETVFQVNGTRTEYGKNDAGVLISYTGLCSQSSIILNVYLDNSFAGKMTYSWPTPGKMVVKAEGQGTQTRTYTLRN